MAVAEDEWTAAMQAMIRKFRSGEIVGCDARLSPEASGAVADALTLCEAWRVAAVNANATSQRLVASQEAFIRQLYWGLGICFLLGLAIGRALP